MGAAEERARPRVLWIFGRPWDLFIALCWVPVFCVWHVLTHLPGATGDNFLRQGVVLALAISFLHQPLTFGLVYADPQQFRLHRRLFVGAPALAVAVAVVAAAENLWIVVPIAALWNLQHTLQQRYGIQRIYAGRSGGGSARLDRAVSYVPMAAALAVVAASPATERLAARSGLDPTNAGGVHLLVTLRPAAVVLAVLALAATAAVATATVRQEWRAGSTANPAKWCYQLSSCLLVASIAVDPGAGFIAYVAAHAIEYAVVVDRTARRRYASAPGTGVDPPRPASLLGWCAQRAPGRVAFFGLIVVGALAARTWVHGWQWNALLYSVGALHFTYDAVIWKLRRPALARDFSITQAPATAA